MSSSPEREIERKLVKAVARLGGTCPKLSCPGYDGMPDRLVLLPGGKIGFIEVKAPGKKPRPLQSARHRMLLGLGFNVYMLDGEDQIGGILDGIQAP